MLHPNRSKAHRPAVGFSHSAKLRSHPQNTPSLNALPFSRRCTDEPVPPALLESFCIVAAWELLVGFLCQLIARASRSIANVFAKAPGVDLLVAMVTWVPWVWVRDLRTMDWPGRRDPRTNARPVSLVLSPRDAPPRRRTWPAHREVSQSYGRPLAESPGIWVTLIALPGFWMIRLMEILAYWPLVVLLGFPKYRQSEWINVSRQKFSGLVGHDLVWCLYCDWMTGVYSLGAEMLRNVESFWCPIRFYEGKKCENCQVDFPDIAQRLDAGGWQHGRCRRDAGIPLR